ncbi:MAG TPA: alpha/beta fold hydrolase [Allosphingosinicella sp.]|jgi:hypothetical protein
MSKFLLTAAAALALTACTARIAEDSLLHPIPGGGIDVTALRQAAPAYEASEQWIAAPDGARLAGILLRQPGARATILYFGGNGYTIERFGAATAGVFEPLGVDLLIVDHRGYGRSEGTPGLATFEGDGIAAFDHLTARLGVPASRIVVHGQSLGSFIAGHVAATRPTAGVVLESSATTTEDWANANLRGAARMFVRLEIAQSLRGRGNLANMPRIEEPVLILAGARDRTTPPRLSRALYDASPLPAGRKTLFVAPGAGHSDVMLQPETVAAYRAFLASLGR